MPEEQPDWLRRKIAEFIGPISQMRLGAGVLGRTGTIALAFIVLCAVGVWQLPGLYKLAPLGAAFLAFLFYQIGSLRFATNNPTAALLEGAHLVRTHLQDARAKEMPEVIEGKLVSDPLAPPAPAPPSKTIGGAPRNA